MNVRTTVGPSPLYSARGPSFLNISIIVPKSDPLPFICTLDFTTSAGKMATHKQTPPRPPQRHVLTTPISSFVFPGGVNARRLISYPPKKKKYPGTSLANVGDRPRNIPRTPSCRRMSLTIVHGPFDRRCNRRRIDSLHFPHRL